MAQALSRPFHMLNFDLQPKRLKPGVPADGDMVPHYGVVPKQLEFARFALRDHSI